MPRSRWRRLVDKPVPRAREPSGPMDAAPANSDATRNDTTTVLLPAARADASASSPSLPEVLHERQLMAAIEQQLEQARKPRALSLIMLAVDGDDRRRRPSTDRVLHQVTELVRTLVADTVLVARTTAHEMALLLPGIELREAERIANALRESVVQQRLGGAERPSTISLGVATQEPWFTNDELLLTAKAHLARARRLGPSYVTSEDGEQCVIPRRANPSGSLGSRSARACLVVIHGTGIGRKYEISGGREVTIGRAATNDVCLRDDSVSRNHAVITAGDHGCTIRDKESKNGTIVNDSMVREAYLCDGDLIEIGRSIFRVLTDADRENAYYEELYQFSTVDGLTQIFNRRYFTETLERELSRARRYERPLSLMMLDLDHFARCNDTHGQLAGDHVLRQVAELLRDRSRKVDVVARHGGDEFAVILPEMELESTIAFAETLREAIEQAVFPFEDQPISITVSIGVAQLTPEITNADELVLLVTERMHRAKQLGRNRVVSSSDSTSTRG